MNVLTKKNFLKNEKNNIFLKLSWQNHNLLKLVLLLLNFVLVATMPPPNPIKSPVRSYRCRWMWRRLNCKRCWTNCSKMSVLLLFVLSTLLLFVDFPIGYACVRRMKSGLTRFTSTTWKSTTTFRASSANYNAPQKKFWPLPINHKHCSE